MNYTLKNYDALLRGVRECDDYWADVGILDAIAFLEAFSDQEWIMLQDLLAERPGSGSAHAQKRSAKSRIRLGVSICCFG